MFGIGGAVLTTPGDPGARRDDVPGDRLDAAVDPAVVDLRLAALQPRAPHPGPDRADHLGVRRARVGGRRPGSRARSPATAHWLMIATAAARRLHRVPHRVPGRARRRHAPGALDELRDDWWMLALIGIAAGALSGLLGIGGGILMVPAFSAWVGLPLKDTIATSLACVGIFAIPGTITHAVQGDIDWTFAIALAVGVIPGAQHRRPVHDRDRRQDAALHRRRRARHHRGHLRGRRDLRAQVELGRARMNTASSIVGREPAGERVLLARMERAEHGDRPARHFEQVREPGPAGRERAAELVATRAAPTTPPRSRTRRARRSPRTCSRSSSSRRRNGAHSSRSAGVGLFAGGAQRTAAAMYASCSTSPSSTRDRRRLVREAAPEHRREQEVAGAVAGEHAAGAVAAVRGGREPDDEHAGARVAEARAPAGPSRSSSRNDARFSRADLLAPLDEPRARAALRDLARERDRDREHARRARNRILRRSRPIPSRPDARAPARQPNGVVGDAAQAREHPQDPRRRARRRGRRDLAPRSRDAARARRRRRRLRRRRGATRATERSTKPRPACCTRAPRSRRFPGGSTNVYSQTLGYPRTRRRRGPRAARRARAADR